MFDNDSGADLAISWLNYLFRGVKLPERMADGGTMIAAMASGLRDAMGYYSLSLLSLAGALLLYHGVCMIVETAHTGIVLGKRANQTWAPIRLVFAFMLLIPVGGGFNAGQYLVLKFAQSGSQIASSAWRRAEQSIVGNFASFVTPRAPDARGLVLPAMEMELCQAIYHQLYQAASGDTAIRQAGDIATLTKLQPQRMTPETWRYSNNLHNALPLCGEFRFANANWFDIGKSAPQNVTETFDNLSSFAHTNAEELLAQARTLAAPLASPNATLLNAPLNEGVSQISGTLQKTLNTKLRALVAETSKLVDQSLQASAESGWITAAAFPLELAQYQTIYGAQASQALPSVRTPAFGHSFLSPRFLGESAAADPVLGIMTNEQLTHLYKFYAQVNTAIKQMRNVLYNQQTADSEFVLPGALDVQDQLTPAADFDSGFFMYSRLLNAAAIADGVWGDLKRPAAKTSALTPPEPTDQPANPIAQLAERGRRHLSLGAYLFGASATGFQSAGMFAASVLFSGLSLCFVVSGLLLLFYVAFLPFVRFFLAVLTWLLAVFEAIAVMPLVAFAHLNPVGEGLSGNLARRSYWLWLAVFMRPTLTLFGLLVGFLLLGFIVPFLDMVFTPLIQTASLPHSESLACLRAVQVLLHSLALCLAVSVSFKGIGLLPDKLLSWINPEAVAETVPQSNNAPVQATPQPALLAAPTPASNPYQKQSMAAKGMMTATARDPSAHNVTLHDLGSALFPKTGVDAQSGQAPSRTTGPLAPQNNLSPTLDMGKASSTTQTSVQISTHIAPSPATQTAHMPKIPTENDIRTAISALEAMKQPNGERPLNPGESRPQETVTQEQTEHKPGSDKET